MMQRKTISVAMETASLVNYVVNSQYELNRIDAFIAQMDQHKSLILIEKKSLLTTHKEKVYALIEQSKLICGNYTISTDQSVCVASKNNSCNDIKKGFVPMVENYNKLLPAYIGDSGYMQLKFHDKGGLDTLDAITIIGEDKLKLIDCDLNIKIS